MARQPVDFSAELAKLGTLTAAQLAELRTRIIAEFEAADADDDVAAMGTLSEQLDQVLAAKPVAATERPAEPAKPAQPPAEQPAAAPDAEPEKPAETPPVEQPPASEPTPRDPQVPGTPSDQPVAAPAQGQPAEAAEAAHLAVAPAVADATTPAVTTSTNPATVTVQEGLPVAASATVPTDAQPIVASAQPRVFAGADIPGYGAGTEFTDPKVFSEAYARRVNGLLGLHGGSGDQIVIASIQLPEASSDRTLDLSNWQENMEKIEAVTNPDAFIHPSDSIVASGGCCAPLVTRYDLWDNGGVTDRPVRDALASFRATRGGIRYFPGPALADVQGALGFWTCADDTAADAANTATWKVCGRIQCPPEQTAELQAITMCLTFGVLMNRIFPEVAAANVKLANVAQARLADSALLAQIKAGSTAVTDSGTAWGAVRDLMNTVGRASMYYRDRYRLRNAPLRVILPAWVIDALRTDLLDGPDWGRDFAAHYGVAEATIREFFSNRNLNVTFALDSATPQTNGGGFFAAISGAALPAWPTTVEWAMFPEGAWLFLDGGQLDLGVIRDSTLVRTNDYMQFSESFEAAAKIGGESLWITSTISVNGAYPVGV